MHRRSGLTAGLGALLLALSWRATAADYPAAGAAGAAKDPAAAWDHLWHEVLVDITVIGVIFALVMAWFLIRYRRKPGDPETGSAPKLSPAAAVAWVVIPVFVFLSDDLYIAANGWSLWNTFRDVPAERMEVQLESGMYSWDYTYPNGVRVQNELRVPAGRAVMLRRRAHRHLRRLLRRHAFVHGRQGDRPARGRIQGLARPGSRPPGRARQDRIRERSQ